MVFPGFDDVKFWRKWVMEVCFLEFEEAADEEDWAEDFLYQVALVGLKAFLDGPRAP